MWYRTTLWMLYMLHQDCDLTSCLRSSCPGTPTKSKPLFPLALLRSSSGTSSIETTETPHLVITGGLKGYECYLSPKLASPPGAIIPNIDIHDFVTWIYNDKPLSECQGMVMCVGNRWSKTHWCSNSIFFFSLSHKPNYEKRNGMDHSKPGSKLRVQALRFPK